MSLNIWDICVLRGAQSAAEKAQTLVFSLLTTSTVQPNHLVLRDFFKATVQYKGIPERCGDKKRDGRAKDSF